MPRKGSGNVHFAFALGDGCEASDVFLTGSQTRRKMRNVAARVFGLNLHGEIRYRDRPQQVGCQPRNVREIERSRGALNAACYQRNRRPGVLVVRMPWAAG